MYTHICVCVCAWHLTQSSICVPWLIPPHECLDSFSPMCATSLTCLASFHIYHVTYSSISVTWHIYLYVWHDTFIYMRDMTPSSIWETWLIQLYAWQTHSCGQPVPWPIEVCVSLSLKMHLERKRITLKLVSPLHRWVLSLLLYLSAYIVYTYIHTYHTCACTLWMKGVIGCFSLATSVCIHHKYILHISTFQYTICVWYIEYVCVYLVNHWGDGLFLLGYIYIHMLLYHNIPRTEEIVLRIITTAKFFNKLARESPYISNTLSRESSKFQTNFHVSQRSPRHSKDLTGIL